MSPGHVQVDRGVDLADALDYVLDEVGGDHGGHVPIQLGQQQHFPFLRKSKDIYK